MNEYLDMNEEAQNLIQVLFREKSRMHYQIMKMQKSILNGIYDALLSSKPRNIRRTWSLRLQSFKSHGAFIRGTILPYLIANKFCFL